MKTPAARLLVLALLSGCTPFWKGQEYEEDIAALQGQVESLTEGSRQQRQQHDQAVAELVKRLEEVEKRLGESISQLQGGTADRGLELEKLQQELREVRGELAEIKHKFDNAGPLGPSATLQPGPGALPLPEDEAGLYRFGWERKRDGSCDDAIRAFTAFATKFPSSKQADNALFLLAECQFAKADHTGSVRALQGIIKAYATGDKTDDALILMHDNFVALGRCRDAQPFLETLIADHPKSGRVAEAKKKLADTKKACK